MSENNYYIYETAIGNILIASDGDYIITVGQEHILEQDGVIRNYEKRPNELTDTAIQQLNEYLEGKRREFDLPLKPDGTAFQRMIWNTISDIPYGQTRSYKEVAEMVGKPDAYRAVGMANNRNPIMIIIPCHRIIGANGSLTGYAGGLSLKRKLLNLEMHGSLTL